jgi:hypothetical protein
MKKVPLRVSKIGSEASGSTEVEMIYTEKRITLSNVPTNKPTSQQSPLGCKTGSGGWFCFTEFNLNTRKYGGGFQNKNQKMKRTIFNWPIKIASLVIIHPSHLQANPTSIFLWGGVLEAPSIRFFEHQITFFWVF